MKLQIEKTEKTEMEIKEPSFYKSDGKLLAVINEDNIFGASLSPSFSWVQSGKAWIMSSDLKKIPEMQEITEEELMKEWEAAVNLFSFTPKIALT